MGISRRKVVAAAATVGAAGALAACEREHGPPPAAARSAFDPGDWASVRAQFSTDYAVSRFAAFVFAAHPAAVRQAIERHRAGLDADAHRYLGINEERLQDAVAGAAARHLGTDADQIAFTDSTTMGLGLLYSGLRLAPGDEVLTTEHDFYATHETLRLRAERDGVRVRRVRLYQDPASASVDEIVGNLRRAVTGRTRVVALTWVHSSTGVKLPAAAIAAALRSANPEALLCLDAVHGFGADDATPTQLGCDFLVSGGHKWLFGPRGTGLIWGSRRGWQRYTPVIPSFAGPAFGHWLGQGAPAAVDGVIATPGGYHSFEHRWALAEAFEFHHRIGPARVATRTRELATQLKDGLTGIRGVLLVTPRDPALSAGLVCLEVTGVPVGEAVNTLWQQHRVDASATPYRPSYLRLGTSIVTDEEDVRRAVRAIRELV